MAENKTKATVESVDDFLNKVEPESVREDSRTLCMLMNELTRSPAVMWGTSMIGFGSYHYRYESGREGDMFLIGFAPRKGHITLYPNCALDEVQNELNTLGKFKRSGGCIHVKSLSDLELKSLKKILKHSLRQRKN
jgi:hypothetical protein